MRNWLNFTEVEVLMIKIIASVSVSPAPPSNSSAVSHSSQLPKANMCQVTRSPALHSPPLPFKVLLQEQKIKRGCDKSGDHAVLIRLPDLTFSIYHWLGSPPCHEWDSTMPTWVTSSFYLLIVWNSKCDELRILSTGLYCKGKSSHLSPLQACDRQYFKAKKAASTKLSNNCVNFRSGEAQGSSPREHFAGWCWLCHQIHKVLCFNPLH